VLGRVVAHGRDRFREQRVPPARGHAVVWLVPQLEVDGAVGEMPRDAAPERKERLALGVGVVVHREDGRESPRERLVDRSVHALERRRVPLHRQP
jgi:hypothetical protein